MAAGDKQARARAVHVAPRQMRCAVVSAGQAPFDITDAIASRDGFIENAESVARRRGRGNNYRVMLA